MWLDFLTNQEKYPDVGKFVKLEGSKLYITGAFGICTASGKPFGEKVEVQFTIGGKPKKGYLEIGKKYRKSSDYFLLFEQGFDAKNNAVLQLLGEDGRPIRSLDESDTIIFKPTCEPAFHGNTPDGKVNFNLKNISFTVELPGSQAFNLIGLGYTNLGHVTISPRDFALSSNLDDVCHAILLPGK
jgi:hypothetical protein